MKPLIPTAGTLGAGPDAGPDAALGWTPPAFAAALLDWFAREGRHDLPWQRDPSPYRVWVSEVMLQQTQVAVVIPYFERFMARLPDLAALAAAPEDEVLHLWSGLGYYARARHLHRAARRLTAEHQGRFPTQLAALAELPGIGRSTAGAILSLALGQRAPILDGNCKRVLTRCFAVPGWPGSPAVLAELWRLADRLTPMDSAGAFNQAMMDLGATRCTRAAPACVRCPLAPGCLAHLRGQTAAFPAPRPRRALPVRSAWLLLVRDPTGALLLHRRAPSGVWGGLWTPPELLPGARAVLEAGAGDGGDQGADASAADLAGALAAASDWCLAHLGRAPCRVQALAARRHDFTHFGLHIRPVLALLDRPPLVIGDDADRRWIDPAAPGRLGLPAPIRRLLAEVVADGAARGAVAATGADRQGPAGRPPPERRTETG